MLAKKLTAEFSKGFTLIELLVVVAIIAVLVTLGATSYSTTQKKGRDTQRISDLKTIQSEVEKYYSDGNAYPNNLNGGNSFTCADGTSVNWGGGSGNFTCAATVGGTVRTYLRSVPKDPLGTAQYCYKSPAAADSQTYTLYARLELALPTTDPNYHNGAADVNCPAGYNYKVTPVQ